MILSRSGRKPSRFTSDGVRSYRRTSFFCTLPPLPPSKMGYPLLGRPHLGQKKGTPPSWGTEQGQGIPPPTRGRQSHPRTNRRNKHTTMARSTRWPYIRRMAWDRDRKAKAPCHICGEPIDYFVQPSSTPDSYEPDHIVPVHMRPDLELDLNNIKASHRRCNRQRGDGTNGTNVIGQRSRIW